MGIPGLEPFSTLTSGLGPLGSPLDRAAHSDPHPVLSLQMGTDRPLVVGASQHSLRTETGYSAVRLATWGWAHCMIPLPQGSGDGSAGATETKALSACSSPSPGMVLCSGQRARAEWRGRWLRSPEREGVGMRWKAGGGWGSWGSESGKAVECRSVRDFNLFLITACVWLLEGDSPAGWLLSGLRAGPSPPRRRACGRRWPQPCRGG